MKACKVCGSNNVERHHIVFRSQAPYMVNIELNQIDLCPEHHRGNRGPHLNRGKDIEYKMELQRKLFKLFPNKYYKLEEIRDKLQTSDTEAYKIVRNMKRHSEGYERVDLVIRMMGGRLYAD